MTEPQDAPRDEAPDTSAARDAAAGAAPVPRPGPPPASTPAPTAAPAAESASGEGSSEPHGRVDGEGNVYVRTDGGERMVGQWPVGDPEAALAFYQKRYDGLVVEVELLEQRIRAGSLPPDEATGSVRKLRAGIAEAQAVGDLAALLARLDALAPLIAARREERKAERAAKAAEAATAKEAIVDEAEKVARGSDWRNGAHRMRELLDSWKVLPRIDKRADDALWQRFSSARTTYTRRRKQHFSELNQRRESAGMAKEKLAVEAEALATSTDWATTARAYRDLMQQWKAAGSAAKEVDDALWKRFRDAQNAFFTAKDAENAKVDQEFAANADVKRGLLTQAEALLPVQDAKAAREAFRAIADRWDTAGKVPRDQMKDLENRFRRVEQAVRGAEDDRWRRSNPEAYARAAGTVAQLEQSIASLRAELDKAEQAGNAKRVADTRQNIEVRQSWLDQARAALAEFSA